MPRRQRPSKTAPRSPRRASSPPVRASAGTASREADDPLATLDDLVLGEAARLSGHDAVLGVLADLDRDAGPTTVEAVESCIAEARATALAMPLPGQETYISDILASLLNEDDDEGNDAEASDRPREISVVERRALEVALARGALYLRGTEGVEALSGGPGFLAMRTVQGRAVLACLQLSLQGDAAAWAGPDAAILEAARGIGRDLQARLPLDCDLECPSLGPVPLPREAGADPLRDAWRDMRARILARDALVRSARAAWLVGADLLATAKRRPEG